MCSWWPTAWAATRLARRPAPRPSATSPSSTRSTPATGSSPPSAGPSPAIRRASTETNAGIHAIGKETPEFRGLGTTSTALVLRPEGAWVGHVGDSRAYRIRDGVAEQLTFDHSWVWEIARRQGV